MNIDREGWIGRSIERVEDAALLTGRGRFIDDFGVEPGTLHAASLRFSRAHADIVSVDAEAARGLPGVIAVITGADLLPITGTLVSSERAPIEARAMAVDRVRHVGEPVAMAGPWTDIGPRTRSTWSRWRIASVRRWSISEAVLAETRPFLHDAMGGNPASERRFSYGDPDAAFAAVPHCIEVVVRYPRNTDSPMETYGVVAEYDPHEGGYDMQANSRGPFSVHAVIARALPVPGNRLRLRISRDSGGSFGVKQGVAPYVVLIAAAARIIGRPVK